MNDLLEYRGLIYMLTINESRINLKFKTIIDLFSLLQFD